ncbi:MAG: hypothetical protein K5912_00635 [Alphaproteobacteria bacterium]|nr:hypothetical protein [Alphaproteobacteria bacterium]
MNKTIKDVKKMNDDRRWDTEEFFAELGCAVIFGLIGIGGAIAILWIAFSDRGGDTSKATIPTEKVQKFLPKDSNVTIKYVDAVKFTNALREYKNKKNLMRKNNNKKKKA